MKVFEFAKEIGLETIHLMDKIKEWGLPVKSHMAVLSDEQKSEIIGRLEEKSTKAVTKKKSTKKKAAASKSDKDPAAKSATKKKTKTSTTKKTVAKKTSTKKVTTKKAASAVNEKVVSTAVKASAVTTAPVATPEDSSARRMVIRRTGDEAQEVQKGLTAEDLNAQKVNFEPAEPVVAREPVKVEEQMVPQQEPAVEEPSAPVSVEETQTQTEDKSPKKTLKKTVITRNNIIGRMDLSRVRRPPQPTGGGNNASSGANTRPAYNRSANTGNSSASGGAARPAAPRSRNLRTGFVAPAPMLPIDESKNKREDFKKRRPAALGGGGGTGAGGEDATIKIENPGVFRSADFRKREAVFQPKKKKLPTVVGKKTEITQAAAHKRVIKVYNTMSVQDLAQAMSLKMPALTKVLMSQGIMAKPNTELDFDTISLIVPEFQFEAENVHLSSQDLESQVAFGDIEAEKVHRAPVVTVMGHVDHGKTTLLDTIRKARVASGEAGGITQHIGAYRVDLGEGRLITFIDTPGHEAFTAMRARGANATDIAIIVVAADDGMMPQTQEAINHAKAAGVPIIVAVNKMDKQGANPDRIKQQLSDLELVPEEWGGTTIFAPVSALKGDGIDSLLESIYLTAEMQELRANPKRSGTGIVIESKVERGKGNVATLLVQDGTVRVGDAICVGVVTGRVRLMMNDHGKAVKEAGPGEPVEISGLSETPQAGDRFDICKDEAAAEQLANQRKEEKAKEAALLESEDKMSLDRIFAKAKKGDFKELPVVLKTDVAGSIEAIKGLIAKIQSDEVSVKFVHTAVGGINESDVLLASAAQGIIIGFNVRPDGNSKSLAKEKGVEIKCYEIIYEIVDDVRKAMSGLLTPEVIEKEQGRAEVREVFTIPKIGTIAGSFITEGKIQRNNSVRLVRDGKVIYTGKLSSLKRFKDDAREVAQGFECGIGIENYNDLKVGDIVEAFTVEEIARQL